MNKKLLVLFVGMLILINSIMVYSEQIKIYNQSVEEDNYGLWNNVASATSATCTMFNLSSKTVDYIYNLTFEVSIHSQNNPSGNCWSTLRNATASNPSGNIISNSSVFSCNIIPNTNGYLFNLSFNNDYNKRIIKNQNFSICFERDTWGAGANYIAGNIKLSSDGIQKIGIATGINSNYSFTSNLYASNTTASTDNYTVNAYNYWNNSNILNFNITLQNGSNSYDYSTNTGTIETIFPLTTLNIFNLTIRSYNYFDLYLQNINITSDYNAYLYQNIINFSCFEKITNNSIPCNQSVIYPNYGNYTFSIKSINYFNVTKQENIGYLENKTINIENFYSTNLSLKSTPKITGYNITNCNYNISGLSYTNYNEVVYGYPNTSVGLINGDYSINALCNNGAYSYYNITINDTYQNLTFEMYTTNSLNITFYDIDTNNIITGINITSQFFGDIYKSNITNTGFMYIDLLSPNLYTILTSASGYIQNSYIYMISNNSFNQINIYLQPNISTYYSVITVKDKFSKDIISGAKVIIQRFDNNGWITEQIYTSDFNGQSQGYFVINTVYYNFLIEFEGVTYFGIINSNSNKKVIYADDITNGINIEIDTQRDESIYNYISASDFGVSLNFTNTSNTSGYFTFRWTTNTGNQANGSLNVYSNNIINCSNSLFTSSGTVICYVNASKVTYFQAIGSINNYNRVSYIKRLGYNSELNLEWGPLGWFISLILIIIGYFAFSSIPSMSLLFGTGLIGLLSLLNLIFKGIDLYMFVGFMAVAFIIAKIPSKSGGNA